MKQPFPSSSPRNAPTTCPHRNRQAFTLVELLVSVAIVAVLSGIGVSIYGSAMNRGAMVKEVNAGKNLIAAYVSYAADHNGRLMPGFDERVQSFNLPDGRTVIPTEGARYPYRIAPYLGYKLEGTIILNGNDRQFNAQFNGQIANAEIYGASLYPAMGINYLYVGGNYVGGGVQTNVQIPKEVALTQAQAGSLLVFASAAHQSSLESERMRGFHLINPPYRAASDTDNWGSHSGSWNEDTLPSQHGNIDFRYSGRAVCAFLDGSIRSLTPSELADMRLWNKNALAADNPNYQIPTGNTGGGGGGGGGRPR